MRVCVRVCVCEGVCVCVRVCVCECEGAQAGSVVEQEDVVEKSITLHRAGHNTQSSFNTHTTCVT